MPRLLDLFCGAGGSAVGYHRAGFDVTGVDHKPMPRFPFKFIKADALEYLAEHGREFDAIHASPPCQAFTTARMIHHNRPVHPIRPRQYLDLLTPTRARLQDTPLPWVIENVPNAPMRADVILCGSMFGFGSRHGGLIRHRWFEFFKPVLNLVPPCQHRRNTISVFGHGGHIYYGVQDWRECMGIDWMTRDELAQAIPPAYTQFIGKQLLRFVLERA